MSPRREEVAWHGTACRGGRLVQRSLWRKRWFCCEVSRLAVLPTGGSCRGRRVALQLRADTRVAVPQPHLTACARWCSSRSFLENIRVSQPAFALAARNTGQLVLRKSTRGSSPSGRRAGPGAREPAAAVPGGADNHGMAHRGLRSTEQRAASSEQRPERV